MATLSSTQQHFFKKYLLETQLTHELAQLAHPDCLAKFGPPFRGDENSQMPMLTFFFKYFLETFPFITNNSHADQILFWQDTVQPFVESFNKKNMLDSLERKESVTKRKQVNAKFLHGLSLFYNSMLTCERELEYLDSDHLKPSDTGKLEKLQGGQAARHTSVFGGQKPRFTNGLAIDVVAVIRTEEIGATGATTELSLGESKGWFKLWGDAPRHNYEFVVQVTREGAETSHFVRHPYHAFKQLERALKRRYPGLMAAHVSKLPHKIKNDDGVDDNGVVKLEREKLRLALRGYLRTLVEYPEIVHSDEFLLFVEDKKYLRLTTSEEQDHHQRLQHEQSLFDTQVEFQRHTASVVYTLSQDFEKFKESLINNPETLTSIFTEISTTDSIDELSPLLRTFLEWGKLEVAATLYQVFLSQDNSSEWLAKCQKFHRLFPYLVIYGILKFTNPVKVVTRVVDLLLINFPTFSVPWDKSELQEASKNTGAKNLLSMIFVMLLDEDLSDFSKELKKLKEGVLLAEEYHPMVQRLEAYVLQAATPLVTDIKAAALKSNNDLLLEILQTDQLEVPVSPSALATVKESFLAYQAIDEAGTLGGSEVYLALKQYWQVLIRSRDKDIMKQLWQEPEITQLIKKFLTIFYQPLMTIFKKCDVHLVFRDFQHFMDDLMKQLRELTDGKVFFMSSVQIFDEFIDLLDRHKNVLFRFIHDLYAKDDQGLFLKVIKWVELFLRMLRMKYVDETKVQVRVSQLQPSEPVDQDLFVRQLDARIAKILERRQLLKEYIQKQVDDNDDMANEWDDVNNNVFGATDGRDFGIAGDDLEEFNLLHKHEDSKGKDSQRDRALHRKIAELDDALDELGTSELDKFAPAFTTEVSRLLTSFKLE